jgi:hypothetical protein
MDISLHPLLEVIGENAEVAIQVEDLSSQVSALMSATNMCEERDTTFWFS